VSLRNLLTTSNLLLLGSRPSQSTDLTWEQVILLATPKKGAQFRLLTPVGSFLPGEQEKYKQVVLTQTALQARWERRAGSSKPRPVEKEYIANSLNARTKTLVDAGSLAAA
jgi:hypothetical protein